MHKTGSCYTASFIDADSEFYIKFNSDGQNLVEDFINELSNYKGSKTLKDFLNTNPDIIRTFKLKNILVY